MVGPETKKAMQRVRAAQSLGTESADSEAGLSSLDQAQAGGLERGFGAAPQVKEGAQLETLGPMTRERTLKDPEGR